MNLNKLKVLPFTMILLLTTIGCEQQREPMTPEQSASAIEKLVNNMVPIEGGTFNMGTSIGPEKDKKDKKGMKIQKGKKDDKVDEDEGPVHQVTISSFSLGRYEVTQEQWEAVMGENPSYFKDGNLPVECVSWEDCQEFITKLNEKTGKQFRLPTEAEWEYAARGGNISKGYNYAGGNDLDSVGWYEKNAYGRHWSNANYGTHPGGQKKPNELGLYDMSGNVWEWCSDFYGDYGSSAQKDPTGATKGNFRVCRGGCWFDKSKDHRVANRYYWFPDNRYYFVGLRLAL
ncbi:MAG: formylglycine-generating enzyme family protein [Prevotella sp.]|nr:formylglycine-generating enzyme family protein [Prevotella sp.]